MRPVRNKRQWMRYRWRSRIMANPNSTGRGRQRTAYQSLHYAHYAVPE
ncbi:hypothetical protein KCP76_01180 [Salmonella enterica subsp. enterica serovar Weltevreden]|nr:hypothetical protein KCP76_01180 [Salmonella enterica subsp. enterica serovar Weltevreden]